MNTHVGPKTGIGALGDRGAYSILYGPLVNGLRVFADPKTGICSVRWERFDTHLASGKKGYKKVNGQTIYATPNHFARAALMKSIKSALMPACMALRTEMHRQGLSFSSQHVELITTLGVPLEYGMAQMRMLPTGEWASVAPEGKTCTWDVDNQWIWNKAFLDECQNRSILAKDTAIHVGGSAVRWMQVDSMKDRHLSFTFVPFREIFTFVIPNKLP